MQEAGKGAGNYPESTIAVPFPLILCFDPLRAISAGVRTRSQGRLFASVPFSLAACAAFPGTTRHHNVRGRRARRPPEAVRLPAGGKQGNDVMMNAASMGCCQESARRWQLLGGARGCGRPSYCSASPCLEHKMSQITRLLIVIPAKAGIHFDGSLEPRSKWVPAFAGMTSTFLALASSIDCEALH
jgi:hypothetical protein